MNILVVDDEYYIVKNIIETTDWSALGIEQAFPAYSASQAKRIFEGSQDIDILLTDIEMPRETQQFQQDQGRRSYPHRKRA